MYDTLTYLYLLMINKISNIWY